MAIADIFKEEAVAFVMRQAQIKAEEEALKKHIELTSITAQKIVAELEWLRACS